MKEYLKPEAELVVLYAQEAVTGQIPEEIDLEQGTVSNPFVKPKR